MESLLPLAFQIADQLKARGESLAVAESSSGGLVSAALLAVPGASVYFLGGAVIYTRQAREALLGLGEPQMQGLRSASKPYAELLAVAVRGRHAATWGLAETGAAGPSGNRYGDPPGHCCLAVDGPVRRSITLTTGVADRSDNMRRFAAAALQLLVAALNEG